MHLCSMQAQQPAGHAALLGKQHCHLITTAWAQPTPCTLPLHAGVTALQNPMDSWSIQDLIHSIRPGLIIETGTANGGSALLWASVMELSRLKDSRVVTIDPRDPSEVEWSSKGGAEREPLWVACGLAVLATSACLLCAVCSVQRVLCCVQSALVQCEVCSEQCDELCNQGLSMTVWLQRT
jgi:hypothetical protein